LQEQASDIDTRWKRNPHLKPLKAKRIVQIKGL